MSEDRKLDAAIIAYLVGDLADPELDALDRRLREDPAAARRFAEICARESLLGWALRMREGHPDHPSTRLRPPAPRARILPFARWAAGLAALLAIGAMTVFALTRRPGERRADAPVAAIATVAELSGAAEALRGERALPLAAAMELADGDRLRVAEGSRVVVAYPDGTRLDLDAGTELRLGARLALTRGGFHAAVAHHDPASPLVATTPQARVEIVGTRLGLALAGDATRLVVDEGRVRLTRLADGAVVEVEAGRATTAAAAPLAGEPLVAARIGSLADTLSSGSHLYYRAAFAEQPEPWPGALATPVGAPAGLVALGAARLVDGEHRWLDLELPRAAGQVCPRVPAGAATALRLRYLAERISTGDLLEVRVADAAGQVYRRRIRPALDGLGVATMPLDGSFVSAAGAPLPAEADLASLSARLVAWDGGPVSPRSQLWLDEVVCASGAVGSAATPAAGADAALPAYRHAWDFDHGAPPEFTVLGGGWKAVEHGGVDGGGCMETEDEYFAASIDIPPPASPVRITFEQSMVLPPTPEGYSVFVPWDGLRSLTYARRPALGIAMPADGSASALAEVVEYLAGDHLESRLFGERAAVTFGEATPGARLLLLIIGRNRIDDLRIESVDAARMPSVEPLRRAIDALPSHSPGSSLTLPPLPGDDPQRPYTVQFRVIRPGASPWLNTTPPPAP